MAPAATEFARVIDEVAIRSPEIPVIGNVTAGRWLTPKTSAKTCARRL
jgi:acyl transferase domain-containing protein